MAIAGKVSKVRRLYTLNFERALVFEVLVFEVLGLRS